MFGSSPSPPVEPRTHKQLHVGIRHGTRAGQRWHVFGLEETGPAAPAHPSCLVPSLLDNPPTPFCCMEEIQSSHAQGMSDEGLRGCLSAYVAGWHDVYKEAAATINQLQGRERKATRVATKKH
ncbi:hypothetical protein HaLaN_03275 [Haematococcus lacustris]|uniref:Uncharacterized protein n=1 Tax=Haematococcus lacustris TaxID=44745 RepID=A0A699YFV3_HAELA|nr:hypothetical protein HaLaN_03275 [Haematococcus lacustris]